MVTALQTLVTRRFDVFDPVVITVGSFHAGTVNDVIPRGHLRSHPALFSYQSQRRLHNETVRLVEASARPTA